MTETISGMVWVKPNHPNPRILMFVDRIRWTKEGFGLMSWPGGKADSKYWTKIGPEELGHWREE